MPLVLHLHGGGLVASFSSADLFCISHWSAASDVPFLYISYSLAPEHSYPTPLDQCYAVYRWAAQGRLGFMPTRIILVGDSTGGHLAVGIVMRALLETEGPVRIPDGLVLAYPTLNLGMTPSTSRSAFMIDPIAPMNLLRQCALVYLPSHLDQQNDPVISPLLASGELLARFPPTSLMCGSVDPFLDDSVELAHRLHSAGVHVRLSVCKGLPHHFLNFAWILPDAWEALKVFGIWIDEHCHPAAQGEAGHAASVRRPHVGASKPPQSLQ
jgi:hormone-sensitive lipase